MYGSTRVSARGRRRRGPTIQHRVPSGDDWESWEFGQGEHFRIDEDATQEDIERVMAAVEAEEQDSEEGVHDILAAIEYMKTLCTDNRVSRLSEILSKRTEHCCFVFEDISNPNNIWACLRSLDAFGVQYAHVIVDPDNYTKPRRVAQMKSATGAQKWLSLKEHQDAKSCIDELHAQGYRVIASDLTPETKPITDIDWTSSKVAVVMGNEDRGISPAMRELCDDTYQIPMYGFAESFNLSVGTAVTLAFLSSLGALKHEDLQQEEKDKLFLRWLIKSVPHGAAMLRRQGLMPPRDVTDTPSTVLGYRVK